MNHGILALTLVFASLIDQNLSVVDPNFEACAPQKCGQGPEISYPFWIPNRKNSICGLPGFEISCSDEKPVLKISGDDYFIEDVFYYTNNTFLLRNTMLYDPENACPIPRNNFSLHETPFQYGLSYMNLSFFYNCSTYYDATYQIPCSSNATSFSFALFHKEILVEKKYPVSSCQSWINAPAEAENIELLLRMSYVEVLRNGFTLQWSEEDNCRACNASGGRCGSINSEFTCFCQDRAHPETCNDGKGLNTGAKIGIGIGVAGGVVLVICLLVLFICRRRMKNQKATSRWVSSGPGYTSSYTNSSVTDPENASTYYGAQIFSHSELEKATNNFDTKKEVGDGGFGAVYQGKLKDGRVVAVKRLYDHNFKRVEQFMNEVEILTRLRHQNLVSLYGCTTRQCRELLLVYEYIPNGTVADHLHGSRAKPGQLSWTTRMNIALETASALAYLHASDVIHRDVKTNNILLDKNFTVKVADFGLSRLFPLDVTHVSTAPQGTPGYVDPEYHQCYHLTDKSDVYSFGVVLIELLSSQPAVDITRHRHEINLANMAINKIQNHALHELVDPNLGFESDFKVRGMITKVAELAFRCLQSESDMRPTMVEVLETLKGIQREGVAEMAVEMNVPADELVLLKSDPNTPVSPDSVMASWTSTATSNASVL